MAKRRTDQEWQTLFEKCQQLQTTGSANIGGFVKAEVIEKTTRNQVAQTPVANMTLSINNVELSVPQGTPVRYLAELIGALS